MKEAVRRTSRLIRAIRHLRPDLPQTASFDTAFHKTQLDVVRRFALPRAMFDAGVKHYGFHGLSYKFVSTRLRDLAPDLAPGRVVAAHLGSGASLCALENGQSRDTSMGFSTLDGIPMATRCGALDPGVVLYLLKQQGLSLESVEDILYHQSGLLGVSGISADSRDLIASIKPAAREAIELFTHRIAREIAALATTLGGLDAVIFTAGIGEHQPAIRAAEAELASLEIEREAKGMALYSTLAEAHGQYRVAQLEVARLGDDVLPKLGKAEAAAERAYRAGAISYLEWAQLQSERTSVRKQQLEAALAAQRALIELQRLTGEPLVADAAPSSQGTLP